MFKSKSQARLMFAAAQGKSDKVSPEVAKEFIDKSKGVKFKRLREKILKPKKDK